MKYIISELNNIFEIEDEKDYILSILQEKIYYGRYANTTQNSMTFKQLEGSKIYSTSLDLYKEHPELI